MNRNKAEDFIDELWTYYNRNSRVLPWRIPESSGSFDGYKILVSEMMLQQTQVERVASKYQAFLKQFPTLNQLAANSLTDVLSFWSGLGYNRRAKYLLDAAKKLQGEQEPWSLQQLIALKGIGPNTAAAICVYSYNTPHVFIETNIRTVYIHHFFRNKESVCDEQIKKVLKQTIDTENPRDFYWALMDYGTGLKRQGVRNNSQSKHYTKQSKFQGSNRQIRGRVIKLLTKYGSMEVDLLRENINDMRVDETLKKLENEGLINLTEGKAQIA